MRYLALGLLLLQACSNEPNKLGPKPDLDSGVDLSEDQSCTDCEDLGADIGEDLSELPSRCIAQPRIWQSGVSAFRDASQDWGLNQINPMGTRISVADIDNDGRPDIFIRRPGRDDFSGEARSTWLLRNTGSGFEDITQSSGIVAPRFSPPLGRPAEVAVFGDMNNDGFVDVVTAFSHDGSSFEGMEIAYNQGDGTFALGDPGVFHGGQVAITVGGLTLTDVDRNGLLDIWTGLGAVDGFPQADRLFQQTGLGVFENVTAARGLSTQAWTLDALNSGRAHSNAWSTTACDLNNDGTPDLLAASYGRAPNHLWRSTPTGFENHSVASGYAFDENQDWTLSHGARCYCQANPTAEDCNLAPAPAFSCNGARGWTHDRDREPYRLGGNSGTTVCADINNDGHLDLVTTEIVHWDVGGNSDPSDVLINDGTATFSRPGHTELGLTKTRTSPSWDDGDITAVVFDFDNDGRNDILIASTDYPGTRAHLYWQRPDGTFQLMNALEGIDMKSSHGVVVADFDGDGDLDILIGHSPARCGSGDHCYPEGERHVRLFENTIGNASNWVQLDLVGGANTNKSAIGARATIRHNNVVQVQEVGGGHGHYGLQNQKGLHFGLGASCEAEVTIRWPNAELTEQTFTVQAGYRYTIVEGSAPISQ